jgi:dihydroorotate dehydrogenase electron transfer subunit
VSVAPRENLGVSVAGVVYGPYGTANRPADDQRTLAPLGRRLTCVVERRQYGPYVVLAVDDQAGPAPDPGQFYMLTAAARWGGGTDERPFLPRAFSVMRHRGETLEFLLEDVGPGTRRLAELDAGDELWLLGPLGNGFAPPRDGRRPVLVGGGVGIAPLVIFSEALGGAETLLGFRDAAHAAGAALIPGARIATDDGSVGHHGFVTELLDADPSIEIYACGPPPMLDAIASLGAPAQLAMESGMACGFGACFGCVVPTKDGYVRLCVDGPVIAI